MTTFAQHSAAFESFLDCVQGGAGKDAIAGCLAENVVLIGPLSDEPLTGREAVAEAIQTVHTLAADLTYEEVLSGETHHAAFFRLQIEDTVVNGIGSRRGGMTRGPAWRLTSAGLLAHGSPVEAGGGQAARMRTCRALVRGPW